MEVDLDPRVILTTRSARLLNYRAEDYCLLAHIAPDSLLQIANEFVETILDIHSRGEIHFIERSHHSEPYWKHDCDECSFLGTWKERDMYFCPREPAGTLIARYGSKEDQYSSGIPLAPYDPYIWAAAVLAEARQLGSFLKSRHTILIDGEVV